MSFEERLFYPSPPSTPTPAFTSSTLILPSISIGNVPQLAIDLLITTLDLPLVGYMTSPFLVPCAGTLETATGLDQGGIACPLEIYFDKEKNVTVIQQRSPFISRHGKTPFVRDIWRFISCYGFSKVIMLASSDAARRTDEQITGPRFRVLHVNDPDGTSDLSETLSKLTLSSIESLSVPPSLNPPPTSSQQTTAPGSSRKFPGSGHLRHFLRMAEQDKYSKREVVALVMFAAEGDNSHDAREMAGLVAESIKIEVQEWKTPKSWEGMFGEDVRTGAEEGLFW